MIDIFLVWGSLQKICGGWCSCVSRESEFSSPSLLVLWLAGSQRTPSDHHI